jgi:hypothetical protein
MTGNTELRDHLAEALELIGLIPALGRKRIEKLFADLREENLALAAAADEARRELDAARKENADLRDRHREDEVRIGQLRQQVLDLEAALNRKAGEPRRGGYDVDMIRDFLEQLLWEVRIEQFESTAPPGVVNPELAEQSEKYLRKYGVALQVDTCIDGDGATEAQRRRAEEHWREAQANLTAEQVGHLEALRELFEEALECAALGSRPGGGAIPTCTFRALDLLPPEEGGNPESPFNRQTP